MKKKLPLILSIVLLSSCGGTNSTNELISESEITDSSQVTSNISTSEYNSPWGNDLASVSMDVLSTIIPYIEADSFEFEEGFDDFGDKMLSLYLYYSNEESANNAFEDYAQACADNGYTVDIQTLRYVDYETYSYFLYDVSYADKIVKEHLGVELQSTVSMKNGKDCLGIFCYTYLYIDENEYPSLAIEDLFGNDISTIFPKTLGEDYKYSFKYFIDTNNNKALEIVVDNCSYEVEEEMFNSLNNLSNYYQHQCDDYDDDYYEIITSYPGYDDEYYYVCHLTANILIIYDYMLDYQEFVIDIYRLN